MILQPSDNLFDPALKSAGNSKPMNQVTGSSLDSLQRLVSNSYRMGVYSSPKSVVLLELSFRIPEMQEHRLRIADLVATRPHQFHSREHLNGAKDVSRDSNPR